MPASHGRHEGSAPPYSDYAQNLCGMLFVEMWSNDDEGFPMPEGCDQGPRNPLQIGILSNSKAGEKVFDARRQSTGLSRGLCSRASRAGQHRT